MSGQRVVIGPWRLPETRVFHLEGSGNKKLLTLDLDGQTIELGEVWKGSRTWSPPAAGFGGRIARFHKQVPCWYGSTTGWRSFDTRKDAIVAAYRYWLEES